ncbi:DUF3289 family protein [[Erwinia] mediterraneensis]|uniref:DUF3289 family protein n=1 Tax=[Erwinia] mediterraneensis TaxID=2161819 RepID=UPI00102FD36B|nr:DUF3289 family protein [[Erwinia] mediterraneensis]
MVQVMTSASCPLAMPVALYRTQQPMDDYRADDMRYGDLTELQLRERFKLEEVCYGLNPWRSEKITYPEVKTYFEPLPSKVEKVSHDEMASLLFNELRKSTYAFSCLGYRHLFLQLVNHMQNSNGEAYRSEALNMAYRKNILSDKSRDSSLLKIKEEIEKSIDWKRKLLIEEKLRSIHTAITGTVLPKFKRWYDAFNGLGLAVHDVYATHITLQSIILSENKYQAYIHYKGQDHFGLDEKDIMNPFFHDFSFFRIWFLLQHWERFNYKPFLTNMEATVVISGTKLW